MTRLTGIHISNYQKQGQGRELDFPDLPFFGKSMEAHFRRRHDTGRGGRCLRPQKAARQDFLYIPGHENGTHREEMQVDIQRSLMGRRP